MSKFLKEFKTSTGSGGFGKVGFEAAFCFSPFGEDISEDVVLAVWTGKIWEGVPMDGVAFTSSLRPCEPFACGIKRAGSVWKIVLNDGRTEGVPNEYFRRASVNNKNTLKLMVPSVYEVHYDQIRRFLIGVIGRNEDKEIVLFGINTKKFTGYGDLEVLKLKKEKPFDGVAYASSSASYSNPISTPKAKPGLMSIKSINKEMEDIIDFADKYTGSMDASDRYQELANELQKREGEEDLEEGEVERSQGIEENEEDAKSEESETDKDPFLGSSKKEKLINLSLDMFGGNVFEDVEKKEEIKPRSLFGSSEPLNVKMFEGQPKIEKKNRHPLMNGQLEHEGDMQYILRMSREWGQDQGFKRVKN